MSSELLVDYSRFRSLLNDLLTNEIPVYAAGTFTPTWTSLTTTGAPIYTGYYQLLGNEVVFHIYINANGGTTASTFGTTYCNNLPYTSLAACGGNLMAASMNNAYGVGRIASSSVNAYTPTWGATGDNIQITGSYAIASVGGGTGSSTIPAYTITNGTIDRAYDANSVTLNEIADVLYTLIHDLGGA